MPTRTVAVASAVGLHARPAAIFTSAVQRSGLDVTLARSGGEPVDAGSILGLMTLGVKHGELVTVSADGGGADAVLDELTELLARDLDAD